MKKRRKVDTPQANALKGGFYSRFFLKLTGAENEKGVYSAWRIRKRSARNAPKPMSKKKIDMIKKRNAVRALWNMIYKGKKKDAQE